MPSPASRDITALLLAWREGDEGALDTLTTAVYAELRRLAHRHMRGERLGHPLQTTALVHEAYLRLIDSSRVHWQNRAHFFAVTAQLMRRVLVDLARRRGARKRGGHPIEVTLDGDIPAFDGSRPDLVAVDEALTQFAELDPRKAKVVELRYFGGLTVEETAEVLEVSPETVMRDWTVAKLWLVRALGPASPRGAR
jgi:RNA polymerase sigma factor (TIGR02999 family)